MLAQDARDIRAMRVDEAFLSREKESQFKTMAQVESNIDLFIAQVLSH